MSARTDNALPAADTLRNPSSSRRRRFASLQGLCADAQPGATGWLAALVGVLVLLGYLDSVQRIVGIWQISDTFSHGFLVVPLFLYLVWYKRDPLRRVNVRADALPLGLLPLAGIVWLLAHLANIDVLEHVAVVAVLVLCIWAVIGREAATVLRFPLCFLFFAAPVGDELVPVLMNVTADLVVLGVRAVGIPVFREGLFFSLPSADWSVIEACSGIRYLIASLFLSSLYAYLTLSSVRMRALFMVMAIAVPIIANGIRAFLIVMIGHASQMQLAKGVDHLVYGWLFFGLVMGMLFSIGALLARIETRGADRPRDAGARTAADGAKADSAADSAAGSAADPKSRPGLPRLLLILALALVWPALVTAIDPGRSTDAHGITDGPVEPLRPTPTTLAALNGHLVPAIPDRWQPHYAHHQAQLDARVQTDTGDTVRLLRFDYSPRQVEGEPVHWGNTLVPRIDARWRVVAETLASVESSGARRTVNRAVLRSGAQVLTTYWWYQTPSLQTRHRALAKLAYGASRLLSGDRHSSVIFIASQGEGQIVDAVLARIAGVLLSLEAPLAEPAL